MLRKICVDKYCAVSVSARTAANSVAADAIQHHLPLPGVQNASKLDLKMCVHYCEYILQKLGDREELVGADVIVPRRMLKNQAIEKTGVKAYALFREAAANALHLSELSQPLIQHTETYEHLGEVKMQVLDLQPVWKDAQARKRHFVSREEALVSIEIDRPYPPVLVWEVLNTASLEARILQLDIAERTDSMGGRVREGAQFHCAHEESHFYCGSTRLAHTRHGLH